MGMVLSAVGACLLFILKAVGILLLIFLVLAALLLLCPFCADVCWQNDTLTVKAGALGITFPVFQYPKPEPSAQPEEPKGFTGRLKAKFRAWRAERKRKKAEKKAAQPAKPKAEKPPRKKAKITLDVVCTMLRGAGTLLRAVFGAIRFTKISVCLGVRGDDPAAAERMALLVPRRYRPLRLPRFRRAAHPAGLWQRPAHRAGQGVLPCQRTGAVHRHCRCAGAVRVLA